MVSKHRLNGTEVPSHIRCVFCNEAPKSGAKYGTIEDGPEFWDFANICGPCWNKAFPEDEVPVSEEEEVEALEVDYAEEERLAMRELEIEEEEW